MPVSAAERREPRFGPFTLDLAARELRDNGGKVPIQGLPFHILAILVERPGEWVTREELRTQLWVAGTFVDFDHGINTAVGKLRRALGDDSDAPRYIETLPRYGYRFIFPLDKEATPAGRQLQEMPTAPSRRMDRLIPLTWGGIVLLVLALLFFANVAGLRDRVIAKSTGPSLESLAVLPVKNFSGDPAQEYLADGMTDSIIAGLAQYKALKVISRTSVMGYKNTSERVPQIARELGVEGIVETSMMRSGNRLRVTAQLIDARRDQHLWAHSYDRELTDALAMQSELVQAITDEIHVHVTPQESMRARVSRRVDADALETTYKGRALLDYATREDQFRQAADLFQTAVDRDPSYAPAWAGLSEALWSMAAWGFEFVDPADVRDRAIESADRALALDENLPEAHMARAIVAVDGEWDLAVAKHHFEKALQLRPGYAGAHAWYGHILGGEPLQDFDQGYRHLDLARQLDPLSPWNDISPLAWWLFQGNPEKALAVGERAYQRHPTIWEVPYQIGYAQLALGQPKEAARSFEAALKLLEPERPAVVLSPLAVVYGITGRRSDARQILAEMELASKQRYISPAYLAVAYSSIDQKDEAFRLLNRALERRTPWLVICVPQNPLFLQGLRRDPRWNSFMDRLRQQVKLPTGEPDPYRN